MRPGLRASAAGPRPAGTAEGITEGRGGSRKAEIVGRRRVCCPQGGRTPDKKRQSPHAGKVALSFARYRSGATNTVVPRVLPVMVGRGRSRNPAAEAWLRCSPHQPDDTNIYKSLSTINSLG